MLLLLYDITNDRIRNKVADCCLDYGLERIQYSAFLGELSRTHREELMLRLKRIMGRHSGVIQSFNLCQSCWAVRTTLGKPLAMVTHFNRPIPPIELEEEQPNE
ncbi:MAG: CRISPR-associated endonuclease Cas2 [Chloroflexota bacterium]